MHIKDNDQGLDYGAAMHGVQSAIALSMQLGGNATEPKHLRVGIDSAHVTDLAIAQLLIDKGIFTSEEYAEYVRMAANYELANREREFGASFR